MAQEGNWSLNGDLKIQPALSDDTCAELVFYMKT